MWFKNMPKFRFNIAQASVPVPENYVQTPGRIYVPCSNLRAPSPWAGAVGWSFPPGNPEVFPEPPVEPVFEVNMMEALVGWKAWGYDPAKMQLNTRGVIWPYDSPLDAACEHGCKFPELPNEGCSCGIYSGNRDDAFEYYDTGDIFGQVYGWGRYVRGNNGWRAQLAYPKCFYLESGQANLIEWLRLYHVPIYIEQPQLIYNPEEDGYEYRREEADGDFRAFEESTPAEDEDSDY